MIYPYELLSFHRMGVKKWVIFLVYHYPSAYHCFCKVDLLQEIKEWAAIFDLITTDPDPAAPTCR